MLQHQVPLYSSYLFVERYRLLLSSATEFVIYQTDFLYVKLAIFTADFYMEGLGKLVVSEGFL